MAAIADLLQNVAQKVRRAPEPTLVHAYREAARKFCAESLWLRRELVIATENAVSQYDLVTDTGDAMLEIIGVRVITVAPPSGSAYRMDPSDPMGWNPAVDNGPPQTWCYIPESEIKVYPTSNGVYTLTCTVECQPLIDTEDLPDDLLRKWDRALSCGALGYLYDINGQPWYNPLLARAEAVKFQAAIANAKGNQQRGYNTGTSMARIRRLF